MFSKPEMVLQGLQEECDSKGISPMILPALRAPFLCRNNARKIYGMGKK